MEQGTERFQLEQVREELTLMGEELRHIMVVLEAMLVGNCFGFFHYTLPKTTKLVCS